MKKSAIMPKTKNNPYIFVVEDDLIYLELIKHELFEGGFTNIETFTTAKKCLDQLHKMPAIIIMDYNLDENLNGLQGLKNVKSFNPDIQVIMLSSQEKIEVAVNSMKYGAYDYVIKNQTAMVRITSLIKRICRWNNLLEENRMYRKLKYYTVIGIGLFVLGIVLLNIIFPYLFE